MQSTSNAVWWIKNPTETSWARKKRKQSMGASFSQDLVHLLRNISMHAYGKLVANELNLWEKLIWLAVHMTTMCLLLTVLSLIWEEFVAQYIVISLHNPSYPVELVPFPSIAICSNNRISQQAAMLHATQLSENDPNSHSVAYFMEAFRLFSNLYYKQDRNVDADKHESFQSYLDIYDTWDNETFYNTKRIMKLVTYVYLFGGICYVELTTKLPILLSPKCKDFIVSCALAGLDIDCFAEKAFQDSMTSYGPCCTFNTGNFYTERTFRNRFVNSDLGLTVVLNTSNKDNFAPILNIDGYIVVVHDAKEFADTASGESQEVFLTHSEESFLALRVRLFDTDLSLRSFGPRTRKCLFDDETSHTDNLMQSNYSFSDCITRCRIRSMLALCRCIPFYMPQVLVNQRDGVVYCTLQHVPCLLSYSFKWRNVLTQRESVDGLERAIEEALFCPQCIPACDDVQYQLSLMSLPIDRYRASLTEEQLNTTGLEAAEMSVLRVHFDEPYAKYYRRMVGNTWFEALCTVGNVTSIFLGFSIVAIFEIAYFILKYLLILLQAVIEQNASQHRKKDKSKSEVEADETKLYICP